MKRLYISFVLTAFVSLLSSCSSDMPDIPNASEDLVPVNFNLSFSGLENDTRSLASGYQFSDGSSISVLKCYVYLQSNGSSAEPYLTEDVAITASNGTIGGNVTVSLPRDVAFDVVFLGTSIAQNNSSSKLYYSTTERTLSVDYSQVSCNDEELDCFFAARSNLSSDNVTYSNIVLSRPFAQLNIGTQDYDSYNAIRPIKDFSVSVSGIYSKISLMDGSLVGSSSTVNFLAAEAPSGQVFPVDGYSYVAMNYLLVNLRTLVDVSLTINHVNSYVTAKTIPLGQMAVERNCQTNAYGKSLLTRFPLD